MSTQAENILKSALRLDADDRVEIAETLMLSLDEERAAKVEAAWAEVIKRRIESIDSGQAQLIPWDEAIRSMREELDG